MVGSNRARYLAPLALTVTAAATAAVVLSGVGSSHRAGPRHPTVTVTSARRTRHQSVVRAYVVQPGDTLSQIASKTGVSLSTLETLNPGVDPAALHAGQRLKLRQ